MVALCRNVARQRFTVCVCKGNEQEGNITLYLCACLTCALHLWMCLTLKPGSKPDTLGRLSVHNQRQSWSSLVKKKVWVCLERERETRIRKKHWPEQLYYCERFTLHFIPPAVTHKTKKEQEWGRGWYRSLVLCDNLNKTGNHWNCLTEIRMSWWSLMHWWKMIFYYFCFSVKHTCFLKWLCSFFTQIKCNVKA